MIPGPREGEGKMWGAAGDKAQQTERGEGATNLLTFLYGNVPFIAEQEEDKTDEKYLDCQWLGHNQIETYVEGIEPTVIIAPEKAVTLPLLLTEEQKAMCVKPTRINYVEREAARAEEREAARQTSLRAAEEREAATRKAYEDTLAKETPEEKTLREEAIRKREEAAALSFDFT